MGRRWSTKRLGGASLALLLAWSAGAPARAELPAHCASLPWMQPGQGPDARAQALVAALSLDQKIGQVHGQPRIGEDVRLVRGIPELCVPPLTITNGPAGVGPGPQLLGNVPATALPSPLLLASTFDPRLAALYGHVQGAEMRAIGRNLLEAPDVDLARIPLNGRTFEAYGEDPLLVSRLGVANIRAIQSHDVLAMAKHYTVNNQELNRFSVDVQVSERALRELYLPPFEAAVREAGVASFMCSYNRVNGPFACESPRILTDILKGEWGFRGFVQSDFGATHSTVGSANAGMDLEMPLGVFFADALRDAVLAGEVPRTRLDDMLLRRYREMFRFGVFDRLPKVSPIPVEAHAAIARQIGAAGTVLLRNEGGLLPLDLAALSRIAVVGPWSDRAATGGGGSSMVNPIRAIPTVEGIRRRVGARAEILSDASNDPARAAALAGQAEVAIVVLGDFETEGVDRPSLALPEGQDALLRAVVAANPRTVVVLHAGAPVLMPWRDEVPAILEGWYPGGEDGEITAAVLFGDANPSGKLPITFPRSDDDGRFPTPELYPGVDDRVFYDEELLVGYRWYQAMGVEPLYPFGFGLSYTRFRLSGLRVEPRRLVPGESVELRLKLKNVGDRRGAEVVQVYLEHPPQHARPPRELRAFRRVELEPGRSQSVRLSLDARALSVWDEGVAGWVVRPGDYRLHVGSSSEDTPLVAELRVAERPLKKAAKKRKNKRARKQAKKTAEKRKKTKSRSPKKRGKKAARKTKKARK